MTESQFIAINGVLDEIEEYLEQRADADGVPSGGGYKPNEAMSLLTDLRWWRTVIKPQPEVAAPTRYTLEPVSGGGALTAKFQYTTDHNGEWVRWEDVRDLFKPQSLPEGGK